MGRAWEKDLEKDGVPFEQRRTMMNASINQFKKAPVVVIVCLTMEHMHRYPDVQRQTAEHIMGIQSVAAAIQNLLLMAHAEGLGACWYCAPLFCQKEVRRVLNAPEKIEPMALITMGFPDEKPKPPLRIPLEEIVHENLWRDIQ